MVNIYTHDKLKKTSVFKYSPHPQLHEEKVLKKKKKANAGECSLGIKMRNHPLLA